jgi:hypothetical protein
MRLMTLPARLLYAVLAAPAAGAGGFYFGVLLFAHLLPKLHGVDHAQPTWTDFMQSAVIGAGAAFAAFFYALTLPGVRLRHREGRVYRMTLAAVLVCVVSVLIASEGIPLIDVFGLMIWLSVTLTFTYIRYGVRDFAQDLEYQRRRRSRRRSAY